MKRCIALCMLAVYLLAVGLPAYAAVTCRCVAMTAAAEEHQCCPHCSHDDALTGGRVHIEAPCCGDHHSTQIELYTGSSQENEKYTKRIAVADISNALISEAVVGVGYVAPCCGCIYCAGLLFVPDTSVSSCGLRAPPVLV